MNEMNVILKDALEYIRSAQGVGVDKTKLLTSLRQPDGSPLSPDQQTYLFGLMEKRGWITYHLDALWHAKRWTLTDSGLTALEAL